MIILYTSHFLLSTILRLFFNVFLLYFYAKTQKRKLPRFSGDSDCLESYFVGVVKAFSKLHPDISLLRTVEDAKPYFKHISLLL